MLLRTCIAFIKLSASHFSTSLKQALATSSFFDLAGVISGLPFGFSSDNFTSATCLSVCMIYSSPDLLTVAGWRHDRETAQSFWHWNIFAAAQCHAPLQHHTSRLCFWWKTQKKAVLEKKNHFSQLAVVSPSSWAPCFWLAAPGSFLRQQPLTLATSAKRPTSSAPACYHFANQMKEMGGGWRSAVISAEKKIVLLLTTLPVWPGTPCFCSWRWVTRDELVDLRDGPVMLLTSSSVMWGMQDLLIIWCVTHTIEGTSSPHVWTTCCW